MPGWRRSSRILFFRDFLRMNAIDRWQKIAVEAAKQCGRGILPQVCPPADFHQALIQAAQAEVFLFCYEGGGESVSRLITQKTKTVSVLIDHRKFMRMITVYLDITAPLYWWKEFDTYKVGTVANSCSTMHKIAAKEFTPEDFSHEHLLNMANNDAGDALFLNDANNIRVDGDDLLGLTINVLNYYRGRYIKTKDKRYWWQLIQLLPSSYNQRRTVMLNYEVLANIYKSRRNHKLDEWHTFCDWVESLPYSELITGEKKG